MIALDTSLLARAIASETEAGVATAGQQRRARELLARGEPLFVPVTLVGLQRPQRARFVTIGVGVSQVGLAHLLDQHAPAREHLHEPGDDRLQQRIQLVVCGRTGFDEQKPAFMSGVHCSRPSALIYRSTLMSISASRIFTLPPAGASR